METNLALAIQKKMNQLGAGQAKKFLSTNVKDLQSTNISYHKKTRSINPSTKSSLKKHTLKDMLEAVRKAPTNTALPNAGLSVVRNSDAKAKSIRSRMLQIRGLKIF